jgi:Cu-processing system permease protein
MTALLIARFTLHEAVRRRLVVAGLLLSVAFLALYALGFNFMYARALGDVSRRPLASGVPLIFAASMMTTLGLYAVYVLATFLALFLSVGSVSGEIDSGTLHALLARPIRRAEFILGRWLAYTLVVALYTALMAALLLAIARLIAGYQAPAPALAVGLMALGAVLLLSLSLLGSALLPTLANGVVLFSLFGLAWMAGIIEYVGGLLGNTSMIQLGIAISLLVPTDGLWRAAAFYIQSPIITALAADHGGLPFGGNVPPAPNFLLWAAVYPLVFIAGAIYAFSKRDL